MAGKKVKMGDGGRTMMTRSMAKQGKQHPLMNHLVLDKVFEYCNVQDLKVVRQVSPLWRDCARKKWDKSVKLRIIKGSEKFKLFLQMVERDAQNPPLGAGLQEDWMTFCAQLKRLEIPLFITLPTLQSLRNALFRCFPNLEHLNLGDIEVLEVGHLSSEPTAQEVMKPQIEDRQRNLKSLRVRLTNASGHLPISWMEVLEHFPFLETIIVSGTVPLMESQTFFQAINRIREEDPSKLNFKHISIRIAAHPRADDDLPPDVRTTLMDKRLQLETLEFQFTMRRRLIITLRDILQVHAGTLRKLAFYKRPDVSFSQISGLPELTKLQELKMVLPNLSDSVEFLTFTPNLKKLDLSSGFHADTGQRRNTSFMCFPIMLSDLKELDIRDFNRTISPENWRSLIQWTPNLESLKICGVDNAKFAMICEGWTKLVELHLDMSDVDASGITGWDEEDVKRFDSMKRSKRTAALPSITVPRANITGLKSLQIFIMGSLSRPPITLCRAAGHYGIEMLPDLRRLCIKNYEIMPKDRDYWKRMHERYPLPK